MPKVPLPLLFFCLTALAGCSSPGMAPDLHTYGSGQAFTVHLLDPMAPKGLVQVHYVPGYEPSALALDAMADTLHQATGKQFIFPAPVTMAAGSGPYDTKHLYAIVESETARVPTLHDGPVLRVFYLNGEPTADALGLNVLWSNIFIFMDAADGWLGPVQVQYSDINPFRQEVERAILVHETGHGLGLVGCQTPMVQPRQDPDSPCHSTREQSVMWAGVHLPELTVQAIMDGDALTPVWTLDEYDREDLEHFQRFIAAHPQRD